MAEQALTRTTTEMRKIEYNTSIIDTIRKNIADAIVMTRRNLLYYLRVPQLLVFSSIQPIIFLLLFTYVFGGSIQTQAGDYINYLLPGILVQTVMFGGTAAAIGLAEDLSKGLIDRFRSLPMSRSAVLAGRTVADSVRNLLVVILMITVGYLIGFRFSEGPLKAIGAIVILLLFGHVISWVFAWIGILVKDPETAQVAGFIWVFPLVFASAVFVPTDTMPSALRFFAEHQPVTAITNVARAWMVGGEIGTNLYRAIFWIVAIWLVFANLAIREYRRAAAK